MRLFGKFFIHYAWLMMLKLAFYPDLTDNNEIKAQKIWEKFLDKKSLQFSHSVSKSQKKSHSTLRAKRALFSFKVDKSSLKMPKMVHFGEFLKT